MRAAVTSWLAALRIARRDARRAKGRSALVVAMIALPVAVLSFYAASYDMFRLTPGEQFRQRYGSADAALVWEFAVPIQQDGTGEQWGLENEDTGGAPEAARETPATVEEVRRVLPPGSRVVPYLSGTVILRTASGIGNLDARAVDVADPIARGLVVVLAGDAPSRSGQVALTAPAAERLGVGVGGTVSSPQGGSWRVTGIVEFPGELREIVVFPPGALPVDELAAPTTTWLVDTPKPVTWDEVMRLNRHGIRVTSQAVVVDPPSPAETPYPADRDDDAGMDATRVGTITLVGGLALLEVVLLAGPAFAVGARRRQRDLALVACNGGTPAHLRRIVLADGVVLGLAGAVGGTVIGLVAVFAGRPLIAEYLYGHRPASNRVFPTALLAIAGLAVVTGVLAALVPAVTAARVDVVTALAGRRGVVRSRKRWWMLGVVVTAAGAAIAGYGATTTSDDVLLAGVVLIELGLVLVTPALVGLVSRLGRLLPPTPRIALRDIGRNRAAAAPAISAVMAAVAGSVAVGTYMTSAIQMEVDSYVSALPTGAVAISNPPIMSDPETLTRRVAQAARTVLDVTDVTMVHRYECAGDTKPDEYCALTLLLPDSQRCPFLGDAFESLTEEQRQAARRDPRCVSPRQNVATTPFGDVVGDAALVAALSEASPDDVAAAGRVLAAGGIVVSDPRYVVDGKVTLAIRDTRKPRNGQEVPDEDLPRLTVPAHVLSTGQPAFGMILSQGVVTKVGFTVVPAGVLAKPRTMPTQADEDRLREALLAVSPHLMPYVERGPNTAQQPIVYLLAASAALVTIGATAIATSLAAADSRADLSTLAAVGASPRVRRLLSLSQSGLIAGLGSLLGVAAGLGCGFAVVAGLNQAAAVESFDPNPYPLMVPWRVLAIVGVVPLIAMLGAGLFTRSRLPIERRLT